MIIERNHTFLMPKSSRQANHQNNAHKIYLILIVTTTECAYDILSYYNRFLVLYFKTAPKSEMYSERSDKYNQIRDQEANTL